MHVDVKFTMAGQTQLGGQLDPGINWSTGEGFFEIKCGITNLVRAKCVLIHDLEIKFVLTGFTQVEGESLVPDGIISIVNNGGLLLVVIVDP